MGDIGRSQKQKRIAERQIKINRKRNEAVASGDDKKAGKLYKKTAKLQEKYSKAGDAKRKVVKSDVSIEYNSGEFYGGGASKYRSVYKDDILAKKIKVTKGSGDKSRTKTIYEPDGSIKRGRHKAKSDLLNRDGSKSSTASVKQITKDDVIKKTVTRSPGKVEKEIERGNKRIEVGKYKDEGVKTRTKINMKKNDQYKTDQLIKESAFRNLPKSMVDLASSPEHNILPANRMDAREQKVNQPMIKKLDKESLKQRKENK